MGLKTWKTHLKLFKKSVRQKSSLERDLAALLKVFDSEMIKLDQLWDLSLLSRKHTEEVIPSTKI